MHHFSLHLGLPFCSEVWVDFKHLARVSNLELTTMGRVPQEFLSWTSGTQRTRIFSSPQIVHRWDVCEQWRTEGLTVLFIFTSKLLWFVGRAASSPTPQVAMNVVWTEGQEEESGRFTGKLQRGLVLTAHWHLSGLGSYRTRPVRTRVNISSTWDVLQQGHKALQWQLLKFPSLGLLIKLLTT